MLHKHLLALSSIIIALSLSACSSYIPHSAGALKAASHPPIKAKPPTNLLPKGMPLRGSFKYDFNRDGVDDWVMVQKGEPVSVDSPVDNVIVKLSQPNKSFKTIVQREFDPDVGTQGYNFVWHVSLEPLPNGDFYIVNYNTDPMSRSNERNSYLIRFAKNRFEIQGYAGGYTSRSSGAMLYDLVKLKGVSSDNRCDKKPQKPCAGGKPFKIKPGMKRYTIESFNDRAFGSDINAHEVR